MWRCAKIAARARGESVTTPFAQALDPSQRGMQVLQPAISQATKRPDRPDVFISYARADAGFVWGRLVGALEERDKTVWLDRVDIPPAADWRDRIEKGIEAARAFVFVISPDAVTSYECGQELRQAITANKRLIPVLTRDVDSDSVSFELKRPNWIELRDDEQFDAGVDQLVSAVETDLEWVDTHARLAVRAKEWEGAGHDASLLLRGSDLRDARRWLADQNSHAEAPTADQRAFILASHQATTRRRIATVGAIAAALVISAALGTLAIIRAQQRQTAVAQRQTALSQRQLADSRQVAFEASSLHRTRPDLSMLLGVEGFRISPTEQARSSLLTEQAQLYAGSIPPQRFGVLSTAFSSDSRTLATATPSTISLWNPITHRRTASVAPPGFTGDEIAYSRDGNRILATGYNGFTVLDAHDLRRHAKSFVRRKLGVAYAAMSPDGKTVATANTGGTIDLVAIPSDRLLRVFKPFSKSTAKVAFDPVDSNVLAAEGDHTTVKLLDVRTGAVLESLPGDSDPIYSTAIAFSPDGNSIAIAARNHDVTVWSTHGRRLLSTLTGNSNAVDGIAFSPDGRMIATASGRTASLWNAASGTQLTSLPPLATNLDGVQFSPDGSLLATSSINDGTVQFWKLQGAVMLDNYVQDRVAFSHSGKMIAVADGGGTVALLDSHTHQVLRRLVPDPREPGVGSSTRDVAFSPDDRLLATAGRNAAWIWSTATGKVVARVDLPSSQFDIVYLVAFSPNGRTLAVAGIPGPIVLYDMGTRRIVRKLGSAQEFGGYERLAFTPNGRDLVAAGVDVEVWNVRTGKLATKFTNHPELYSAAVSPDGRTVAAGYGDGSIVLWDLKTHRRSPRQLSSFGGHLGPVQDLAFSPNGEILASGGQDSTVKLWNVRGSRTLLATLSGHTDSVKTVAFAPNGTLASGGQDGALITWELNPHSVSRGVCQTLQSQLSRDDWARYVPNERFQRIC